MERIAFYLDEHLSSHIAAGLRLRDVSVVRPPEVGSMGFSDEEHLTKARSMGRVLVTHDDDFLAIHARGVEHGGIAFAQPGTSVREMIHSLLLIWGVMAPQEMLDHVEFIPYRSD